MGFKDFHLTLVKSLGLGRFLKRDGGGPRKKKGKAGNNNTTGKKRPSWLTPVSHGYHAVEGRSPTAGGWAEDEAEVVVQREEVEECEWWFYGVLHARIGAGVTEYLQDHLFNGKLKESQMRLKSKETMKKAHLKARTKITMETETPEKERHRNLGSASAIVINGERLVIANMGDYKAVICNDGVAFPVGTRRHQNCWSCKLFPGAVRNPRMHTAAPDATSNADS
ncbi:unnamed protein product [Cuscuta campestris]|uniref:PPM-type phosphatase domain-containing protein n=1 Tax=Cuscuta campestris TaxID=132261 RepID=A0A484NKN4_9ASTE|nr:unnamed protein product [Cuscuta campestris]